MQWNGAKRQHCASLEMSAFRTKESDTDSVSAAASRPADFVVEADAMGRRCGFRSCTRRISVRVTKNRSIDDRYSRWAQATRSFVTDSARLTVSFVLHRAFERLAQEERPDMNLTLRSLLSGGFCSILRGGIRYNFPNSTVRCGEPIKQSMAQTRAPLSKHLRRRFGSKQPGIRR